MGSFSNDLFRKHINWNNLPTFSYIWAGFCYVRLIYLGTSWALHVLIERERLLYFYKCGYAIGSVLSLHGVSSRTSNDAEEEKKGSTYNIA